MFPLFFFIEIRISIYCFACLSFVRSIQNKTFLKLFFINFLCIILFIQIMYHKILLIFVP